MVFHTIMFDEIFLLVLCSLIAFLFSRAFRTLPGEDWQVIACLPGRKGPDGIWNGVNLTYYGFFNALAYLLAVMMFLLMMGALGISIAGTLSVVIPVLVICMRASRFIARWVEKKQNTFSVGAASFVGIIIAPIIIVLADITFGRWWAFHIPVAQTMAAMLIAYATGEGVGRLACISFGCCYGKPLSDCSPMIQKIFRRRNFIFRGKTKKIAYAGQLEGRAVIPIQALTAVLYTGTGLMSFYLFLKGFALPALILSLLVTQSWRFASEFLRADHRGQGRISAYQLMALLAMVYMLIMMPFISEPYHTLPNLMAGLTSLWHPGLIIFLVLLWVVVFAYTGKSDVTFSTINIQINGKNI